MKKITTTLFLFGSYLLAMDDSFMLGTIAVNAKKIDEFSSIQNESQIDSISSKEKDLKNTNSLGAMLEDISGVDNISTGPQAGKAVIRGMSGERVKVLSNSMPMDFQNYGSRHIANSDLFLADSIEVIRGAQSSIYSSDALGGVINIVSPSVLSAPDGRTKVLGEVMSGYATNNSEKSFGVKTQSAYGKYGLNLGYSKRFAGNFKTPTNTDGIGKEPLFRGRLDYTNFKTDSFLVAAGYTDEWGKVTIQNNFWQSYQNYLGHTATPPYSPLSSAGQRLTNNETQIKALIFTGDFEIKPFYSRTKNDREAATNTPFENMESKKGTKDYLDIEVVRDDFKLSLTHPKFFGFSGEIGAEYGDKRQKLKSGTLSPSANERESSIFAFEKRGLGDFGFEMSGRYSLKKVYAKTDAENSYFVSRGIFNQTNNSRDFDAFGGSIGASYTISKALTIGANLSRGFRAPSIFELFAGGVHGGVQAYQIGNPDLKEELSTGGELYIAHKSDWLKAKLNLYQTRVKDYIYLANTGYYRDLSGNRYSSNAAGRLVEMQNMQTDARIEGAELDSTIKLPLETTLTLKGELIKGYDTKNGTRLPLLPPANAKVGLKREFGSAFGIDKNSFGVDMKYVASASVANPKEPFAQYNTMPFGSADTKSYTLFGLEYTGESKLDSKRLTLGVRISNLFDKAYRDYLDTYKGYTLGMGRSISFSAVVEF